MISPEMLRRYPFFAGLSHEQLVTMAMIGDEQTVEAGRLFFHEGDMLDTFYLVVEGEVAIMLEVTAGDVRQTISRQLTGAIETAAVTVSQVGPGESFGWTTIAANHHATAGAKAVTATRVLTFGREKLLDAFEKDCNLGYRMLQQILRVARQRLHDLRVESLAQVMQQQ
jgi:CRP-like cAMP-binding protein